MRYVGSSVRALNLDQLNKGQLIDRQDSSIGQLRIDAEAKKTHIRQCESVVFQVRAHSARLQRSSYGVLLQQLTCLPRSGVAGVEVVGAGTFFVGFATSATGAGVGEEGF